MKDPAILPNAQAPSADHPSGIPANASPSGGGNGSPVNLDMLGDVLELTYKLIRETGLTFNNLPDNTTNGFQLMDALRGAIKGYSSFDLIYKDSPIAITFETSTFGEGKYLIFGTNPNTLGYLSSNDANTWTSATLALNDIISSSTYGGGQFVILSSVLNTCYTSPDGAVWTLRSSGVSDCKDVIYDNDLSLYIGVCSTNSGGTQEQVITSTDGITWIQRIASSVAQWDVIIKGSGILLGLDGANSVSLMTSADGITWTARSLPSSIQGKKAAYGNNIYVCGGSGIGPNQLFYSTDGITWIANTAHFSNANANISEIIFAGGQFHLFGIEVISAIPTNVYMTSPDGINWFIKKDLTGETVPNRPSCYGDGRLVSPVTTGISDKILVGL